MAKSIKLTTDQVKELKALCAAAKAAEESREKCPGEASIVSRRRFNKVPRKVQ